MSAVVTVIVPGRDVAAYAPDAIASLRAQTLENWQAILIDDGSLDDTRRVFDDAAAEDERFTVIHHDRPRGLGAARNAGLDRVTTPMVAFLDADDELTPTALEVLVGTLAESGSDFVAGAYVRLRPTPEGGYAASTVQPWVSAATDPARVRVTLNEHPDASGNIVAWSKVSRVELWRRAGLRFPENTLYEDQILAQLMFTRARSFDVIPDVVVRWRERADGTSITQGKGRSEVLSAYLDALSGGLAVLDAAGFREASRSRIGLILSMDVPPLVELARTHEDPAYRARVGAFLRDLVIRADRQDVPLPESVTVLLSAARLW